MPFDDVSSVLIQGHVNQYGDALELQAGLQFGRGILEGLAISAGSGFTLNVASGSLIGDKAVSFGATTTTVPPSSTVFVWRNVAGAFTTTATSADAGGTYVCLGRVTTDGSGITAVSTVGRMELPRWSDIRTFKIGDNLLVIDTLNGRVGIGKVPTVDLDVADFIRGPGLQMAQESGDPAVISNVVSFYAKDVGGTPEVFYRDDTNAARQMTEGGYLKLLGLALALDQRGSDPSAPTNQVLLYSKDVSGAVALYIRDETGVRRISKDGALYIESPQVGGHIPKGSVNVESISGNKTLTLTDANIQRLTPSGAGLKVILPSSPTFATWFDVYNDSGTHTLALRDSTDTTTLATIATNAVAQAMPKNSAGSPVWPTVAISSGGYDV